jgi:hypothetical protein
MDTASWKPGTSRWAYLLTAACCVYLAVSLPLAIAVNTEKGWITFSIFMTAAAVNPAAAWLTHRNARHATAPASSPAPHRKSSSAR